MTLQSTKDYLYIIEANKVRIYNKMNIVVLL